VNNLQITEPKNQVCNYTHPNTANGGRLQLAYNYWNNGIAGEYAIKNAVKGKYSIKVNANDYYGYSAERIPIYLRVVVFKNFQKENATLEIKNIALDNQYGVVEIDEVNW
ncbi:MAG: hypothetical protein ACQUYJ_19210, partial [Ferruginibacter sp.]